MLLRGRVAVIPGASRPIGRAIARRFGRQGASLVLPVFDWPDSIVEMEKEFADASFDFLSFASDLRDKQQVAGLAAAVEHRFGGVDYLVNNIERGGMPVVHGGYELPHNEGQWDLELNTTLKAKWLLFQHLFPLMGRAGGAVVNISSIAALLGRSGPAAVFFSDGYSAANRAIASFTESWARQAAPHVRVNELMLGLVKNRHGEGTRGWGELAQAQRQELVEATLLGRTGEPEEVADAVYFLAVVATYCTGTVLRMDGGFVPGVNRVPPLPEGILKD